MSKEYPVAAMDGSRLATKADTTSQLNDPAFSKSKLNNLKQLKHILKE